MIPVAGIACLLALVSPPGEAAPHAIPQGETPAAELSTATLLHHEVLRIDRDFGMPQWEIVLDGWLVRAPAGRIHDVRLWWVNTAQADRRKPFSARLQRFLQFTPTRGADEALSVLLAGDDKEYAFTVALDAAGVPGVLADVRLEGGTIVPRCRCESARLLARRVLGIPIGIATLSVQCRDADGTEHRGEVPHTVPSGG